MRGEMATRCGLGPGEADERRFRDQLDSEALADGGRDAAGEREQLGGRARPAIGEREDVLGRDRDAVRVALAAPEARLLDQPRGRGLDAAVALGPGRRV